MKLNLLRVAITCRISTVLAGDLAGNVWIMARSWVRVLKVLGSSFMGLFFTCLLYPRLYFTVATSLAYWRFDALFFE